MGGVLPTAHAEKTLSPFLETRDEVNQIKEITVGKCWILQSPRLFHNLYISCVCVTIMISWKWPWPVFEVRDVPNFGAILWTYCYPMQWCATPATSLSKPQSPHASGQADRQSDCENHPSLLFHATAGTLPHQLELQNTTSYHHTWARWGLQLPLS